jgi:pyrroline-5-carboxylate reductase
MGGALLESWRKGRGAFTIVDPFLDVAPEGVELVREREALGDARFDVIVIAIKPQMIAEIMPPYARALAADGYVLSIAAGSSIASLERAMGDVPVVRVMPNLPAAIGMAVSGICASPRTGPSHRDHARDLMERAGTAIAVADEDALDRLTAVAGSGPGYVFELARAYVAAAIGLGFSEDDARAMVLGTLEGAIAMARDSDETLAALRDSVTSKGGTTAAGLSALNGEGQLSALFENTLTAAYDRAVELR